MSQQEGLSFKEFRQCFQTEEACEAYLFRLRWPSGFVCPKCGGSGYYQLHDRREYVCKHCHHQCSVTAGTVLHRTHLPLTVWFWAIYFMAKDKRGISAVQLSRELEISYSSAWYLLHRLRKAMGQRDQTYILSGIVELDDAYFGSSKPNGKRGRGTGKTSALVAVSLTKKGHPQFLKVQVSKLDAVSAVAVARRTICPGSEIHSDALDAFRAALRTEYTHQFQVFGKGGDTLHWVHTLISNIKAFFLGRVPKVGVPRFFARGEGLQGEKRKAYPRTPSIFNAARPLSPCRKRWVPGL